MPRTAPSSARPPCLVGLVLLLPLALGSAARAQSGRPDAGADHHRAAANHSQTRVPTMTTATRTTAPRATTAPHPVNDPQIDPRVRAFLAEINKDSSPFWELPGPQVRATLTGLQAKTPVDLSGISVAPQSIAVSGRTVRLYVVKPQNVAAPSSARRCRRATSRGSEPVWNRRHPAGASAASECRDLLSLTTDSVREVDPDTRCARAG